MKSAAVVCPAVVLVTSQTKPARVAGPALFCSSAVKSRPRGLHHKELRLEVVGYFFGTNIDTNVQPPNLERSFFGTNIDGNVEPPNAEGSFFGTDIDGNVEPSNVQGSFFGTK